MPISSIRVNIWGWAPRSRIAAPRTRNRLASIARSSSFGSAAGKGRAGLVDARDVAAVAARVAAGPAAHAGKTYRLTGPELVSN